MDTTTATTSSDLSNDNRKISNLLTSNDQHHPAPVDTRPSNSNDASDATGKDFSHQHTRNGSYTLDDYVPPLGQQQSGALSPPPNLDPAPTESQQKPSEDRNSDTFPLHTVQPQPSISQPQLALDTGRSLTCYLNHINKFESRYFLHFVHLLPLSLHSFFFIYFRFSTRRDPGFPPSSHLITTILPIVERSCRDLLHCRAIVAWPCFPLNQFLRMVLCIASYPSQPVVSVLLPWHSASYHGFQLPLFRGYRWSSHFARLQINVWEH